VDENTYGILVRCGIRFISDELSWDKLLPERTPEGLISHPMNVVMDHDHIYHAHRTPEYVAAQKRIGGFASDPALESWPIDEWARIVERQVAEIERRGGIATVLMHPLCMFLADRFAAARRLLDFFSQFVSLWASETERYVGERR
jgi:hypothetical protein